MLETRPNKKDAYKVYNFLHLEKPESLPVKGYQTCFLHMPATVKSHTAAIVLANWNEDYSRAALAEHGFRICRSQVGGSCRNNNRTFPVMTVSKTDQQGFETILILYRDATALVARSEMPPLNANDQDERFVVLPIVFTLSSVVRRDGCDELNIGMINQSRRRHSNPIIKVSNPKFPGSFNNLTYKGSLSGSGINDQERSDIVDALMAEAEAWAGKIEQIPPLFLPVDNDPESVGIATRHLSEGASGPSFTWPAALPSRTWTLRQERQMHQFLEDVAQWILSHSKGRCNFASIEIKSAQPRQKPGAMKSRQLKLRLTNKGAPVAPEYLEAVRARVTKILECESAPIPLQEFIGHEISRDEHRSSQNYKSCEILACPQAKELSNHERLKLIQRFGTMDATLS